MHSSTETEPRDKDMYPPTRHCNVRHAIQNEKCGILATEALVRPRAMGEFSTKQSHWRVGPMLVPRQRPEWYCRIVDTTESVTIKVTVSESQPPAK